MKSLLKKLLGQEEAAEEKNGIRRRDNRVALATAVICIEMAKIDGEFSDAEQGRIRKILSRMFDLSDEEISEIIEEAEKEMKDSLDTWKFTNIINRNFDRDQKRAVIESVWKVVYADGSLDKHEDYLVHKLQKLLNLAHSDLIEAKLRVLYGNK